MMQDTPDQKPEETLKTWSPDEDRKLWACPDGPASKVSSGFTAEELLRKASDQITTAKYLCRVHDLEFGIGRGYKASDLPVCPRCAKEEIFQLRETLDDTRRQLEQLRTAIGVVKFQQFQVIP